MVDDCFGKAVELLLVEFQKKKAVLRYRFFEVLKADKLGALLELFEECVEVSGFTVERDDPAINVAAVPRRAERVVAFFDAKKE